MIAGTLGGNERMERGAGRRGEDGRGEDRRGQGEESRKEVET